MNELKKRLTKFFYEATRVKSYIDFSGENYQKAKDSELSSGRINSLATNEFWVENKPSDTKKDKLEVILIPKVLAAVSVKFLLLIDLLLQFFLSWICARSQNADILIACSFAIGFLKGFLMLWVIRYAQKIFSAKNIRSEFYSYFYPLVYGGGQASMLVTAQLAYHYNWKYMYYFMMLLILVSVLFVIICFRHNRPIKSVPLSDLHIREMFIISVGLLMLIYVINYGKVLDWMASAKLCAYIVISPILIALFIWIQHHSKNPYVSLAPLFQPKPTAIAFGNIKIVEQIKTLVQNMA